MIFRIPPGRFCKWLCRRTNPHRLVTRWPFGVVVRLRFWFSGGCLVLLDRVAPSSTTEKEAR